MKTKTGFIILGLLAISIICLFYIFSRMPDIPSNIKDITNGFILMAVMIVAILCAMSIWLSMFFDFLKYKKTFSIKYKVTLWILLFGLNWVGAILYFLIIYYPRVKKETADV
jgi:formate/nitrite transporter FocA (FNT family)